jgi:DmsE family decaheme c-type cytochrome
LAHADTGGDVSKIFNPLKAKGYEVSEKCLACHEKGERKHWTGSAHDGRGLSCSSCHRIHHEGEAPRGLLAKATEFDTCTSCHLKKKGQLMRSYHMPMREKSMTCSSCHQAHGSTGPSLLSAFSVNDNCYQCHAEKRAPMMWEHAPVKENCTTCHDPHSSMHVSMLKTKQPRLCSQCHDENRHPTPPRGSQDPDEFIPSNYMFGHSCLNCHPQVHGTNHPSGARLQR